MTVTLGHGTDPLHLRQSESAIKKAFGKPAKRRKSGSYREYWLYPDYGFECVVSRRSHRVLSYLLHPNSSQSKSDLLGYTAEAIQSIFGSPALSSGGVTLGNGDFVGPWYSYDTGIGFHFDESGHVKTVAVFAPKRKAKAESAEHKSHGVLHDIAALRQ